MTFLKVVSIQITILSRKSVLTVQIISKTTPENPKSVNFDYHCVNDRIYFQTWALYEQNFCTNVDSDQFCPKEKIS